MRAREDEKNDQLQRPLVIDIGGGGGNRTRVQNASRLPELQPYVQYEGASSAIQELPENIRTDIQVRSRREWAV